MNIGIVGLGLIGGSLGLELRSQGHRVLGVSRKSVTCDRAVERGAVDVASDDLSWMGQAEVVFLCTPLGVMEATAIAVVPHLAPGALLTDVGSVKGWVMAAIAPHWANFVGGHPMAGTADSGIEAAQRDLFVGCTYVLTPSSTATAQSIARLEELLHPLRAKLIRCSPEDHDRAVAWISHLPVIVSASLVAACAGEGDTSVLELAKTLASSGFRDTSRVGSGNPELGVMMAKYNTEALMRSLQTYRQTLDQLITQIEQGNWTGLEDSLGSTQQHRPDFLR